MEKAKQRAREHDIVYERQLAKERAKEDHLFGDKEKFVTSAYKKKLMEDAKWLEEERVRELREQKHEVGNKSDMSDFYRNLLKNNEAFGGRNLSKPTEKSSTPTSKEAEQPEAIPSTAQAAELGQNRTGLREEERDSEISHGEHEIRKGRNPNLSPHSQLQRKDGADEDGVNASRPSLQDKSKRNTGERPLEESVEVKPSLPSPTEVAPAVDPVAAARERYLARKRQRG
jgi:coiled-coil domain-containing protein 55